MFFPKESFLQSQCRTSSRLVDKIATRRRGISLVLISLLLPVVLMIAAFAINVVYMELARTELQIATDVATRAAGRTLAVTGSQEEAIAAADRLLKANPFCNQPINANGVDIVFGTSTRYAETEKYSFDQGSDPNAVQVKSNGSIRVPTLFPTMGVPIDYRPIKSAVATRIELDIALVVDCSTSMAFSDIGSSGDELVGPYGWIPGGPAPINSRWRTAEDAISSFLDMLAQSGQDEHVSLISMYDKAKTEVDLTNQFTNVKTRLAAIKNQYRGGSSNVGAGILQALSSLADRKSARPWATRVLVLLTDGRNNFGVDPVDAAKRAASQNVLIYTVTFANEADIGKMQTCAKIGSGKHVHATNGTELQSTFEDLARSLPVLITY